MSTSFRIPLNNNFLDENAHLPKMAQQIATVYATPEQFIKDEGLRAMGAELWQALDIAEPFETAFQQAGNQRLSIIIESDLPAVQSLPWETLHHPEYGFVGKDARFALSRSNSAKETSSSPLSSGPLRVLLFTSLPDDVHAERGRLNVEAEQTEFLAALSPFIADGSVEYSMPDDGRFQTLIHELQNFKPHLLIMSGHGKFIDPLPIPEAEPAHAVFQFEDEHGHSHNVKESEIGAALKGSGVVCVLLSACESGQQKPSAELNNGLLWHIAAQGIPHVIGMRESVLDAAATKLATTFCTALLKKEPVDIALQRGRHAITQPLDHSLMVMGEGGLEEASLGQWCLPLLLSQDPSQPLIEWHFTRTPQEKPVALILSLSERQMGGSHVSSRVR